MRRRARLILLLDGGHTWVSIQRSWIAPIASSRWSKRFVTERWMGCLAATPGSCRASSRQRWKRTLEWSVKRNAVAGAFRALLEHHEQWERLCADPSLIPNAVEESLRFYPSVPQLRRITRKPESDVIEALSERGAVGYLVKHDAFGELLHAITGTPQVCRHNQRHDVRGALMLNQCESPKRSTIRGSRTQNNKKTGN
jgi:hypothetical protein